MQVGFLLTFTTRGFARIFIIPESNLICAPPDIVISGGSSHLLRCLATRRKAAIALLQLKFAQKETGGRKAARVYSYFN
jgi:hypothetical protein